MRQRHRGTDGGARGGLCTSNKSARVLGGRERRRALFQTSPLIYLKLESCRANDGAATILRLPLPSRRRAILRFNSSVTSIYLTLASISDVMTSKENSTWKKKFRLPPAISRSKPVKWDSEDCKTGWHSSTTRRLALLNSSTHFD